MSRQLRILVAAIALLATALGSVGCLRSYVVVPRGGGASIKASSSVLVLEAVPNAWRDDPVDLNVYLTPIWVQLVNRGNASIRILFADLELVNSAGEKFDVMSPYTNADVLSSVTPSTKGHDAINVARVNSGVAGAQAATDSTPALAEPIVDLHGSSEWYFDKPWLAQERVQLAPVGDGTGTPELVMHRGRPGGRAGAHAGHGPAFGGSYYGPPPMYGYHGFYSSWPYHGSFYYGPRHYYWVERHPVLPSEAMKQRGLREGVLPPGRHASGFVYFRQAATEETNLELRWSARTIDGKPFRTISVPLSVVED